MYTGFNVHTLETIAAGENALEVFANLMKVHFTSFLYIDFPIATRFTRHI
jgi:hypothetical protein